MNRKIQIQEQVNETMVEEKTKKNNVNSVEDLPGVGPATAEKLKESGFDTLLSLAVASPRELVEAGGLTEATASKVINVSRDGCGMGFESADELLEKRKNILKLTSGSKAIDVLLGGGIESGGITEFFGEFGSSKTQIAHQLAVNIQLPKEKGGAEGICVYIDTEGSFRPERIKQMAEALGLDPIQTLKNIKVARAFNSDHQMLLTEKVEDLIKKENLPVRLVIVDSLMGQFRAEFAGRGMLADRQQKLNKHMHTLARLATTNSLIVYATNQVMARPDVFFGDPTAAIGGHIVGHNCLRADSLLQLPDGEIKPITDCYDNNEVACIKFNDGMLMGKKEFINFYINLDAKKYYSIDTGYKIECSPEHRLFRLSPQGDIEEVTAENLKLGEFVACVKRINVEGREQKLPDIKVEKIFEVDKSGVLLIDKKIKENNLTREEFCKQIKCNPRHLRRILNQGYSTTEENLVEIGNSLGLNTTQIALQVTSNKHKDITIPQYLTPGICQIMGYFVGDGNFEERSLRFKEARIDILEHYKNLFKQEFNVEGIITKVKNKNCYQLNINSSEIRTLFELVDNKLMTYVSKSPNENISAFIKGFADAEGFIDKKRPTISISQKDEFLLKFMQMLLLRLGVRSTLEKVKNKENQQLYNLMFHGRNLLSFGMKVGLSAKDKKAVLEKWMNHCINAEFTKEIIPVERKHLWGLLKSAGLSPSKIMQSRTSDYKYTGIKTFRKVIEALESINLSNNLKIRVETFKTLINGDVEWRKIRKIKQFENKEPLYDIEVPGEQNYIANCFVVHNSQTRIYLRKGKKGTRVAKLIDSPHLPDGEAIFKVEEGGIKDV